MLGTFLRGPNWNFFGPFEYWDIHKLEALTNVNLSEYIWVRLLGHGAADELVHPRAARHPARADLRVRACRCCWRRRAFKRYYEKLGAPRFYVDVFLFLMMMSLPIKMLLRWIFNLKYIVAIPEFFFNI